MTHEERIELAKQVAVAWRNFKPSEQCYDLLPDNEKQQLERYNELETTLRQDIFAAYRDVIPREVLWMMYKGYTEKGRELVEAD